MPVHQRRRPHLHVLLPLAALLGPLLAVGAPPAPAPAAAQAPVANGVTAGGGAPHLGPDSERVLNSGVVGITATPSGQGFWQVASDGGVFSYGDARFFGSAGGIRLHEPIVGMAAHPSGDGYWLVASDGGVFAYGVGRFHGSMGGARLNQPVVAMAATPSGDGYWLVASDGGIFAFGDAPFLGSTGSLALNRPVRGMAATASGRGYRLVASDGGIFAFGDARFFGSLGGEQLDERVVGMANVADGGYLLATRSGRVVGFGTAEDGSQGGADPAEAPVVAIAARPGGGWWLAHGEPRGSWHGDRFFPEHRVVAFYGSSVDPRLGVLGEGSPAHAAQRLLDQASAYEAGGRPVVPAFEFIATIATASPGPSRLYRAPTSVEEIRPYLEAVRAIDGILILDIQPGRGDFLTEAQRYEELLREPDVSLALDPEWNVGSGQRPGGGTIGSVDAAEVNQVSAWLSDVVVRDDLPAKLLVVHRFTPGMVTNADAVVDRSGLEVVFHADGFGSPEAKFGDYRTLLPDRFARGFKVFYQQDVPVLSPSQLLALDPPPDVITYQ